MLERVLLGPDRSSTVRRDRPTSTREPASSSTGRVVFGVVAVLLVVAAGVFFALRALTAVSLTDDPSALARVDIRLLGGRLTSARAVDSDGKRVPLALRDGRLTPLTKVRPGETITVDVEVHRPAMLSLALGATHHSRLTITAPKAQVTSHWITAGPGANGGTVDVGFDKRVARVVYGSGSARRHVTLTTPRSSLAITHHDVTGTVKIAAAPRPWEYVGEPTAVTWFPASHETVAVGDPTPGAHITPTGPISVTFSKTVDAALGSARPTVSPAVPGHWHTTNSHTLVFTPSRSGLAFGSSLTVTLPREVAVVGPQGAQLHSTRELTWSVPPGSMVRVQQLLAQAGYLPLDWAPSGAQVANTAAAQAAAAVDPPKGGFTWRYSNVPPELKRQWSVGQLNEITRGALMMFQSQNDLSVDAVAGPQVFKTLLANALTDKRSTNDGYSYVYVHRRTPQKLTLWHNGKTILTSPGNTGVPAAPTQLGTFPVFEHLAVTTMSGTNPDGSHYKDPGIKWVSYFNGGDALHSFPRASFGTPQSLGCVELPLAAAAKIWPYTPVGTLVTIEN